MRRALVSLFVLAAPLGGAALAQTAPAPPPAPSASPPAAPAAAPPTESPVPPAAPSATVPPPAAAETPPAPPAPPPPPAPPTDPTAIEVLSVLQQVCIPATVGGDFGKLAKSAGFRKNSDNSWTLRQHDFTMILLPPGSNPTQCHIDLTHPADLDSPGRPIVLALDDWARIERGWSLYRNDKSVQDGMLFTTRSWQIDADGKEQSLVFTNERKPDGSPMRPNADQSELIYGVSPVTS